MWGVERVSSRREKILVGTSGELEEERKTPESTDSFKAAGNGVFVASKKKKTRTKTAESGSDQQTLHLKVKGVIRD